MHSASRRDHRTPSRTSARGLAPPAAPRRRCAAQSPVAANACRCARSTNTSTPRPPSLGRRGAPRLLAHAGVCLAPPAVAAPAPRRRCATRSPVGAANARQCSRSTSALTPARAPLDHAPPPRSPPCAVPPPPRLDNVAPLGAQAVQTPSPPLARSDLPAPAETVLPSSDSDKPESWPSLRPTLISKEAPRALATPDPAAAPEAAPPLRLQRTEPATRTGSGRLPPGAASCFYCTRRLSESDCPGYPQTPVRESEEDCQAFCRLQANKVRYWVSPFPEPRPAPGPADRPCLGTRRQEGEQSGACEGGERAPGVAGGTGSESGTRHATTASGAFRSGAPLLRPAPAPAPRQGIPPVPVLGTPNLSLVAAASSSRDAAPRPFAASPPNRPSGAPPESLSLIQEESQALAVALECPDWVAEWEDAEQDKTRTWAEVARAPRVRKALYIYQKLHPALRRKR